MNLNTVPSIEEIKKFCTANFIDESPFIDFDFFKKLETTKCTTLETGWIPEHIIIKEKTKLKGIIPNYRKLNSNGEYVFDHIFANAYNQLGIKYFPKFLSAIPFTPVNRNKFYYGSEEFDLEVLSKSIIDLLLKKKIPSFHINFLEKNISNKLKEYNFIQRLGIQYYWYNNSYKSFECFLSSLKRKKRKNIIKEREFLKNQKISFVIKESDQITFEDIDYFYKCYSNTINKKWSIHYLNNLFFRELLKSDCKKKIIIIQAFQKSKFVGCSLHFKSINTLYGRYWGALKHIPFLHFELCYYQAIEFAIKNKLRKVEAGAQGEHKISRGYLPELTYSNHWFDNPKLKNAISEYMIDEGKKIFETINFLKTYSPFKS